jgi:hypothetical protein
MYSPTSFKSQNNHTTFNIIHLCQPSPPNQTQQPQPETTMKQEHQKSLKNSIKEA